MKNNVAFIEVINIRTGGFSMLATSAMVVKHNGRPPMVVTENGEFFHNAPISVITDVLNAGILRNARYTQADSLVVSLGVGGDIIGVIPLYGQFVGEEDVEQALKWIYIHENA